MCCTRRRRNPMTFVARCTYTHGKQTGNLLDAHPVFPEDRAVQRPEKYAVYYVDDSWDLI